MRDSKGMDPRRWGGTDRNEKGNCSQKILFEKRICFQKKELGNLLKKEKKKQKILCAIRQKGFYIQASGWASNRKLTRLSYWLHSNPQTLEGREFWIHREVGCISSMRGAWFIAAGTRNYEQGNRQPLGWIPTSGWQPWLKTFNSRPQENCSSWEDPWFWKYTVLLKLQEGIWSY